MICKLNLSHYFQEWMREEENFITNALKLIHGGITNLFTYNNKGTVVPLSSQFSF